MKGDKTSGETGGRITGKLKREFAGKNVEKARRRANTTQKYQIA